MHQYFGSDYLLQMQGIAFLYPIPRRIRIIPAFTVSPHLPRSFPHCIPSHPNHRVPRSTLVLASLLIEPTKLLLKILLGRSLVA